MIRKQRGMISVESRKLITSELSFCYATIRRKPRRRENSAHLDKSSDDPEGGEAEVFERSSFAGGIQKRIEK